MDGAVKPSELTRSFNLSPFMNFLGAEIHVDAGKPVVSAQHRKEINNSVGTPHGGFISSMLNAAATAEIESVMGHTDVALRNFNVNYLRVLREAGSHVSARAEVLHATPSSITTRAQLAGGGYVLAQADAVYEQGHPSLQTGQGYFVAQFNQPEVCPKVIPTQGFEAVQAAAKSAVPPYMKLLDVEFKAVELGKISLIVPEVDPQMINPDRSVDPGFILSIVDSVGIAGRSATEEGKYTMNGLEVNILEPLHADQAPFHVVGTVTKTGRKLVLVEANVTDDEGNWKATANLGCMPL